MSRIYDNWEKLVEAVLRREKDRQLALFESFSSSIFSSRPSFDSDVSADPGAPSIPGISITLDIKTIQFEELKLATQNFQPDMLLGEGRFGLVFKGWIHEHFLTAVKPGSGIAVAVKKLNKRDIYYLNRQHHPNLVKLIGYGFEEGNIFLVHEFMPNGSLDNHLFTRRHQCLSWETRSKVAIGAARGLSFLHDLGIIVSHEGVKTSSILLDDDFNANLSDLDLARDAPSSSNIYPSVMNHYAAPEYTTTGRSTMESDVYSFGIVLLELLSGLRVHDHSRPMKEQNLVIWARPYLSNRRKLLQIVDTRLEEYPHDGAYKVGKLSSQCLSLDPKLRPRMSEVVDALEQLHCLNTEVKLSSLPSGGPRYHKNPKEQISPTGTDIQKAHAGSSNWHVLGPGFFMQMDQAGSSNWHVLEPASRPFSQKFDPADLSSQNIFLSCNVMAIEYEVIKKATNYFQPDMMIGEGGFGRVYRGWIHGNYLTSVNPGSGISVAVKKMGHGGGQGRKEWVAEVNYLSQLRHPNLVKLIGYSFDTDNRIVIYEYMPRGSLNNHLFSSGPRSLPWATKIKVALGAARALAFLHGLEIPLIHRNITSSNILLDADFNSKLSDFGLAIDGPSGDETHVSTRVMGTYGYAAPEYIATGHLTRRCDVYGFGVVLIELLSGRRGFDKYQPEGQRDLVSWAKPYLGERRRLSRIIDSKLQGEYPRKEAYKVGKIALQCVSLDPILRPRMSEVVAALEKL